MAGGVRLLLLLLLLLCLFGVVAAMEFFCRASSKRILRGVLFGSMKHAFESWDWYYLSLEGIETNPMIGKN
jgi:hypothetical protein